MVNGPLKTLHLNRKLFQALGISTTEIYVTWDYLTGHTYEISDKNTPSYKFSAEFGEINLKNLSPGTGYTFVLKVTRQGLSNEVELRGCTIQLPPTGFTYTTYSDWDTVTLAWTATNPISGGIADNFKIKSPGASDVTVALSDTTKDVTLTELTPHTFSLISERTCANGDILTSASSSVTVQGGIEDFALTKVARTPDSLVIDVNEKNSETTFTYVLTLFLRSQCFSFLVIRLSWFQKISFVKQSSNDRISWKTVSS